MKCEDFFVTEEVFMRVAQLTLRFAYSCVESTAIFEQLAGLSLYLALYRKIEHHC